MILFESMIDVIDQYLKEMKVCTIFEINRLSREGDCGLNEDMGCPRSPAQSPFQIRTTNDKHTLEFFRGEGHKPFGCAQGKGAALLRLEDGLRRAAKVADVDAAAFGTA